MPASTTQYYEKVEAFYTRRARQAEHAHIVRLSTQLYDLVGAERHAAIVEDLPDDIGYPGVVRRLERAIACAEGKHDWQTLTTGSMQVVGGELLDDLHDSVICRVCGAEQD